MSDDRYYLDRDTRRYDDQGVPNESVLLQSWFVVDSAPGLPYAIVVAEFNDDYLGAESAAVEYAEELNARERGGASS